MAKNKMMRKMVWRTRCLGFWLTRGCRRFWHVAASDVGKSGGLVKGCCGGWMELKAAAGKLYPRSLSGYSSKSWSGKQAENVARLSKLL